MFRKIAISLLTIGINSDTTAEEQSRIKFINILFLLGFLSVTTFACALFSFQVNLPVYLLIGNLCAFLFAYFLMHKGLTNLAPFTIIHTNTFSIVFISYYIIGDVGAEYLLLSTSCLPFLAFSLDKKRLMFLSVFTTFLCGFLSLKLDLFSHGIFTLPQDQQNFLIQMCYLEAFLLISAQMFILLFEMEDRYKMYLESRTLLNSQSRLSDLGVMTAGIAHEINNPLSIVSGLAQLGLSRTKRNNITKEIHTDNYEKIIHQTKRITKIISGLKFISRDGKKDPFETQFIDKPIIEACELCKTKLDSKNIKSFLHLKEKELPVSMRVVQIEQVIFTLISNAMDALEELPSHSKKEILIEIFSENQFACIRVRDNGPGVPKAIKDQIMKPFFTTKSVGKGTGLGLSVAQDIIKSHKGEILLEATELGASFLIKLPINISTLERIQDIQLSDEPKAS